MKIAQVCHRYYPNIGGVEKHVKEISERLVKKFEVEVISADYSSYENDVINGVKIRRFKSFSPNDAYFLSPQIYFYLRKADFDIIHAHNYHAFPALFTSLAKGDRKFIFTPHYHGIGSTNFRDFLIRSYKFIGLRIFKSASKIICVSNYEKDLVIKNFRVGEEDIVVIPNGINLREIRESKPFEFKGYLILYLGRLEMYKNIHFVIKTIKYFPENFYFYIGGIGRYEKELRNLIVNLDLEDRVKLLGSIPEEEKYRWMKTCSLFVNLSSVEAFGLSVIEALAAGKPVIINEEGGLRELAEKFDCVFPVRVNEVSAEKLAKIMEEKIGESVQADLSEYDWDDIAKKVEDVYLEVNERGP